MSRNRVAVASRFRTIRAVANARAEFTVEPFNDGELGAHVMAAIEAARASGLEPHIGPFATAISGDDTAVAEAIRALTIAALAGGATRISITVERH
jgi:uncharacterized protein YqgV (UPF0045/DUF77 family)